MSCLAGSSDLTDWQAVETVSERGCAYEIAMISSS